MHMQAIAAAACTACVPLLVGCATDPTGFRLHIDTDLRVPEELASIRILIEPAGTGAVAGLGLDRTVVPGVETELPIVIGIVPQGGDASRRVHVVVDPTPGPELDRPLVAFDRVVSFEADTVIDLYAPLPASCAVRGLADCTEPCGDDDDCHDGIACTEDRCGDGACVHEPDDTECPSARCDPGAGCRGCSEDTCVAGPCETASCVDDRCVVSPVCADDESCCAGECVASGCDDGDACTHDRCDPDTGCTHEPVTADADGRKIEGCPRT